MSADTLLALDFIFYMLKFVMIAAVPAVAYAWFHAKYIGD